MEAQEILDHLDGAGAVLTDTHVVLTGRGPSGKRNHGTAYIDMRRVGHQTGWIHYVGINMGQRVKEVLGDSAIDLVVGPETLGRDIAKPVALALGVNAISCEMVEQDGQKVATFNKKTDYGRLVPGMRCAIVDDLLTTGSSVKQVAELIESLGGIPVVAVVVVRRTPDVSAEDCGTDHLLVMADVPGFVIFTEEQCKQVGPCSKRVPVLLRPGHGHEWILEEENRDYPVAS